MYCQIFSLIVLVYPKENSGIYIYSICFLCKWGTEINEFFNRRIQLKCNHPSTTKRSSQRGFPSWVVFRAGAPLPGPYLHFHVMVLWVVFIHILSCWRPWSGRGGDWQVSSRYEGAHVCIMREDIVSDELTEEQHQIHKFYLFTFTVWIRYKEKNQQFSPLDIVGKKTPNRKA